MEDFNAFHFGEKKANNDCIRFFMLKYIITSENFLLKSLNSLVRPGHNSKCSGTQRTGLRGLGGGGGRGFVMDPSYLKNYLIRKKCKCNF